jgi:hypothetical protein
MLRTTVLLVSVDRGWLFVVMIIDRGRLFVVIVVVVVGAVGILLMACEVFGIFQVVAQEEEVGDMIFDIAVEDHIVVEVKTSELSFDLTVFDVLYEIWAAFWG